MRFSVDAHAIGRHLTGNEVYVRNLLHGLVALDQKSDFIAYLSRSVGDASSSVPARFVRRPVSSNSLIRLGLELSWRLREDRPDLIHVQYTSPLSCPVPVVVSVHDVSFLEHPEYFTWKRSLQLRYTVKRTVQQAAMVITPSEFSRAAILRAYRLDPDRVEVVPIAASPIFRPVSKESAAAFTFRRFGTERPFVMTVGDLQPRKNQIGLIEAFEQLITENPSLPHKLLIVGKNTWFSDRVHARARQSPIAERIQFTGWVNDEDLLQLYNAASLFVFPSWYEGFGLPVLEAMACGCAVACSNASAIPEVADSAALMFDPGSRQEMVRALRDLLFGSELRARMERLGLHRASLFTWERTARRTLRIYGNVAGTSGTRPVFSAKGIPATRT